MYHKWFLLSAGLVLCFSSFSAPGKEKSITDDNLPNPDPIVFTPASASAYIISLIGMEKLWRSEKDTLKFSLSRLIDHFGEPFDSVRSRLSAFPYLASEFALTDLVRSDTLPLRWLDKSVFIIDTVALEKDPFIKHQTLIMRTLEVDTSTFALPDTITDLRAMIDSLFKSTIRVRDTITEVFIDYKYLEAKNIRVFRKENAEIIPPVLPPETGKTVALTADSSKMIISEFYQVLMANPESPFYIVPGRRMPDSLMHAVETLLAHTYARDSILLQINNIEGRKIPFWLTTGKDNLYRFWVKNSENDSITIWLGNPSKYDITMILEEDVSVERMQKISAADIPITTTRPNRALAKLKPLEEIPVLWYYGFISSFSMNQNYLANWSRGGQSSLSGMLDVRAEARYTNKETKETWTNSGRLRYGSIWNREQGIRTSTDNVEFNSQYNRVLINKLDFSSVFYGKTQIAKGFNFPNDSVAVSKFLNPGTFTVGMGVEYKPFKETLINFSALSYKNTFVLDTANINQAAHGVAAGKRSKQEMGGQLVIRNKISILDGMNVSNSIRLFSNYLDKPQNVDVDWEMSIEREINWFFTILLNMHLIYDDDIRFPVMDNEGNAVLLPDGKPKKVAKTQFNQFLGITLSLRI